MGKHETKRQLLAMMRQKGDRRRAAENRAYEAAKIGKTGAASRVRRISVEEYAREGEGVVVAPVAPVLVIRPMGKNEARAFAEQFLGERTRLAGRPMVDMLQAVEFLAGRRVTRAEALRWVQTEMFAARGWAVPAFEMQSALTADEDAAKRWKELDRRRLVRRAKRAVEADARAAAKKAKRKAARALLAPCDTRNTKG